MMLKNLLRATLCVAVVGAALLLPPAMLGCSQEGQPASPDAPGSEGSTADPGSGDEGSPRLEIGTLDQAATATGLEVSPPGWLPEGATPGSVRWSAEPPVVYQDFVLADGRTLVLSARAGELAAPAGGERLADQGLEGYVRYVAPESGDAASKGMTTFDWASKGVLYRLEIEGEPDSAMLLAVAASLP